MIILGKGLYKKNKNYGKEKRKLKGNNAFVMVS